MKTYKDIVLWSIALAWGTIGLLVISINKDCCPFVDITMLTLLVALIMLRLTNKKFKNWLDKKI